MTALEISNKIFIGEDEFQTPDQTPERMNSFINDAIKEVFMRYDAIFETDEKAREALLPCCLKINPPPGGAINLDLIQDFYRFTSLEGIYSVCGVNMQVPIKPFRKDQRGRIIRDSFSKPTNRFPRYESGIVNFAKTITIYSETPASTLIMEYLRNPKLVDLVNAPNAQADMAPFVHVEVVERAQRKIFKSDGDPRYAVQENETIHAE